MDFFDKIRNLTHSDFDITGYSDEQKQLYNGAKSFLGADEKTAEQILRSLYESTQDAQVKNFALDLLFPLLLWQDRFDELAKLGIPRNNDDEEQIAVYDTRNIRAVLSSTPKELPMPPAFSDLPSVCVQINGVDVELLIDTGAMLTMVSETVAKKCGIAMSGTMVEADTPLENSITTQIAAMDSFMVGNSEFRNKPCVVVPDSAYDTGDLEAPPINGKIGWEIMKNLCWTINYRDRLVRIETSKAENKVANMCCDFFPMVNVKIDGKNMAMGIDTGGGVTQFGKCVDGFFADTQPFKQEAFATGAIVEISGALVPHINAYIGESPFAINNAISYSNREYSLSKTFLQPGVLGSDIAKGKTLVIDYPNRNLSILD
ncbi:MAG: retroviral-like aspartic protease family protein [Defluviitaleaceae bacterium]|nr:retroviral-like aspartic protease family protein [Defluviitaleaceae bacterium]